MSFLPIATQIQRLANKLNGKTWVLYFSPILCVGSRIASYKDKQLEIAHVKTY